MIFFVHSSCSTVIGCVTFAIVYKTVKFANSIDEERTISFQEER